jgi:hypothetical protein
MFVTRWLILGLAASLPLAMRATAAEPGPPPALVLSRYIAGLESSSCQGREVAVEIEAALPKHGKHARLSAIRHCAPAGKPEYQILHIDGDRSVRQQVIARYLSAETQAVNLPSSAVAVTPENYKFRYSGSAGAGDALTYIFQITPRKKKVGLMKGELWIDAATAVAVHQAGRLVKNPSIFLRRVDVMRDTYTRDGVPYLRITRLAIDTRLVGRAALSITERPCAPASDWAMARFVPNAPNACPIAP